MRLTTQLILTAMEIDRKHSQLDFFEVNTQLTVLNHPCTRRIVNPFTIVRSPSHRMGICTATENKTNKHEYNTVQNQDKVTDNISDLIVKHQQIIEDAEIDLDFIIYNAQFDDFKCESAEQCVVIQRLLRTLQYFSWPDIVRNVSNRDLFEEFMQKIHFKIIDDYIHLVQTHGNDLDKPYLFSSIKCDNMKQCEFTARRQKTNIKVYDLNPKITFYKNIMDSLHFYLFHLYHSGLRVTKHDEEEEIKDDNDDTNTDDEHFDKIFYRLNKQIEERKHLTKSFERFKSNKNNKFNLAVNNNNETTGDTTSLDALYDYLSKQKHIPAEVMNKLKDFVNSEEFDTESLRIDLHYYDNVANFIQSNECIGNMNYFIQILRGMS